MTETKAKMGAALGAAGRFVGRHKKLFVFLAVLAVAAVVALVVLGGAPANAAAGAAPPQTTRLEPMDLEQIVSGTGTLQSSSTRGVNSNLSYEVTEILVQEGDQVEAGQTLALLDTTDIEKSIAEAQKNISDAAASDALSLSQAERKLQDAYNTRDLNAAKNEDAVNGARDAVDAAKNERDSARKKRDEAKSLMESLAPAEEEEPGAEYQQAQLDYEAAQAEYSQKKAAVETAEDSYDRAVETKDTTYRNDSISIENAQDAVDTQKLRDSAASYRTQLENYQDDLADCTITAPVAGTVTAMTAQVGSSAGGSMGSAAGTTGSSTASAALFTIEDTSRLEITASIPEYDVVNVRTGMQVTITTDALTDSEWTGTVASISAKATDDSGNFTVVAELLSPAGELAIGMSAKLNIITQSRPNVFAVPYDAVTTNEAGETVVYVLEEGAQPAESGQRQPPASAASGSEPEPRALGRAIAVQTGMETDYYIEIISAELAEGMMVLTDPEGKNLAANTGDALPGMGMMGRGA